MKFLSGEIRLLVKVHLIECFFPNVCNLLLSWVLVRCLDAEKTFNFVLLDLTKGLSAGKGLGRNLFPGGS